MYPDTSQSHNQMASQLQHLLPRLTADAATIDSTQLKEMVVEALRSNSVEALCCLLSYQVEGEDQLKDQLWLEEEAEALLCHTFGVDGAECAMTLLNCFEEARLNKRAWAPQPLKHHWNRPRYIDDDESYCAPAPDSAQLIDLSVQALKQPTPATRVARALQLQASRLRKAVLEDYIRAVPDDMPAELGFGGVDLSDGAEPKPIQWINEVDNSRPPLFLFSRRCIPVDIWPDFMSPSKQAKACFRQDVNTSGKSCSTASQLFTTKPDGFTECNWACTRDKTCEHNCPRRSQQQGVAHSFQVFKHPSKGWCLRTLSFIAKGDFIMEYVGERVSTARADVRIVFPNVETFIMGIENVDLSIDALEVRNHAAFAAFACKKRFANMEKVKLYTYHWDQAVPHVGFYATCDIQPGEELTYLRGDKPAARDGQLSCTCGNEGCAGRL